MSISANIPDMVKTELNLAIAEAARTYKGVPKGYNHLHVTPLYDVLNKTYVKEYGIIKSIETLNFYFC